MLSTNLGTLAALQATKTPSRLCACLSKKKKYNCIFCFTCRIILCYRIILNNKRKPGWNPMSRQKGKNVLKKTHKYP